MKRLKSLVVATLLLATAAFAQANAEVPAEVTLIKNVNVWDGRSDGLKEGYDVLIVRNLIEKVAKDIPTSGTYEVDETSGNVKDLSVHVGINAYDIKVIDEKGEVETKEVKVNVIDGGGRTLIPGLIDMHSHLSIHEGMLDGRDGFDQMAIGAISQERLRSYLDQGFTTARDAGGNVLGLAKAERLGRIPSPRIFACGGFLTQTGGHGDVGRWNDQPGSQNYLSDNGFSYMVDGKDEVIKAARYNLRAGATQIKIMAGGGVASEFDPLHMTQFTLEEMKAAVDIAADYGTYVMAHAYHDSSVNRAIDAGVRVIEHNFLVSEETIKRMKAEGIALSSQSIISLVTFANPEQITFFSPDQQAKGKRINQGAAQMFEWARQYELIMVTGGDMFGVADGPRQAVNMTKMKDVGFSPVEILKMGTSNAAEVLSWSGDMNPYKGAYPDLSPEEKAEKGVGLGVIEEGAYADVVLIDGNPLEEITLIEDYKNNMKLIIKNGEIWKNTL
ncbi:MAG: amidohydrolase family protein [bacterium]|nr:amidohydrolase family protein [bacterium]